MKNIYIYFISITFILVSCNDEFSKEVDIFNFDQNNSFKLYQDYQSADGRLTFSISKFHESRCPEGAMCFWQGEARITILFQKPKTDKIELNTYNNLKDTVFTYEFELIEVTPYPIISKEYSSDDYRVTVKIKEI